MQQPTKITTILASLALVTTIIYLQPSTCPAAEPSLTDEQMMAAGMIPGTSDQWPAWSGPYGNHAAKDCKDKLVDDVSKARVAWVSEGYFKGPNDCHKDCNLMGSPIVAEDKVYVYHYTVTDELIDELAMARDGNKPKFDKDTAKVFAEDRLHCMDFKTGKKLWETVMPKKGINWNNLNWAARMQLVYGDGRVYCQGSSGACYGVDAKTGQLLWKNDFGKDVLDTFDQIVEKVRNKEKTLYGAIPIVRWHFSSVPAYVDGVVVFGVNKTLHAFDAKTGKKLWEKDGMLTGVGADIMAFQRPGHKPAVLTCAGNVRALDVHTGDLLWEVDPEHGGNKVSRYGDYLIINSPNNWKGLAVIKVENGKGRLLWSNAEVSTQRHLVPCVNKGHIFVYGSNNLVSHGGGYLCLELETGKVVKKFWGQQHWRDLHWILSNDRLYWPGGVLNADPSDFREIGVREISSPADARDGKQQDDPDVDGGDEQNRFPKPTEPKEGDLRFVGYLSPLLVDGYILCRAPYRVICWDLRATSKPLGGDGRATSKPLGEDGRATK